MKRSFLLSTMIVMGSVCFGQGAVINSSHSNIRHPGLAVYTAREGLTLSFKETELTPAEKKELAEGYFIAQADIVLSEDECKKLKAPVGTTIKAGKYPVTKKGGVYIVPLRPEKK